MSDTKCNCHGGDGSAWLLVLVLMWFWHIGGCEAVKYRVKQIQAEADKSAAVAASAK